MAKRPITDYPNAPDIESSTLDYATRFNRRAGAWFLFCQKKATQKLLAGTALNVLDVGGGHGQNINTVIEQGHTLTILGSNGSSIEMIQDAIENSTISYNTGNLLALPYDDNSFDVVISYRTFSHMEQWENFIGELARVAKSRVIVDYPSNCSFNIFYNALFFLKKKFEPNTREYNSFASRTIEAIFEKHGFRLESQYKQYFLPMALHRMLDIRPLSESSESVFRFLQLTALFGSPVIACFEQI
jgi:ubiquinone/menaquinone biosynthesis C-methylase UbiE